MQCTIMPYIVDVLHPVDRVAVSQIGLQGRVQVAGIGRLVGIGCRCHIHCQVYGREGKMCGVGEDVLYVSLSVIVLNGAQRL